ncbi:MAG: Rpn family recombination-promoting nuclease/putative transposase [Bacteroidales bacterium]|jgi:hypothetical protein|nr:Rpn family recombination-promoting nuclease/putative transposase [Bacteroidales bacterium]
MTMADKYTNPYTDFGFKKLFGTEANMDLLIDFLCFRKGMSMEHIAKATGLAVGEVAIILKQQHK